MKEIAILFFTETYDQDDYYSTIVHNSIDRWTEVTDDTYNKLKKAQSRGINMTSDRRWTILVRPGSHDEHKFIENTLNGLIQAINKEEKAAAARRAKEEAAKAKRAEAKKARELKKKMKELKELEAQGVVTVNWPVEYGP